MAWAKNGTPDTLTVAGDDIDITNMTVKEFNQIMYHGIASGDLRCGVTLNNVAGTTYAERHSNNGAADTTTLSTGTFMNPLGVLDEFTIMYFYANGTNEILGSASYVNSDTAGATTAPKRAEWNMKSTSALSITRIDFHNNQTGDADIGSNVSALGTD